MPKFVWILLLGGLATYFVHRTHKAYTLISAAITLVIAFLLWKRG